MSFIDFSKIKMLQKKPKTLGEKIQSLSLATKLISLIFILAIAGGSLSTLRVRTQAQDDNTPFTKLVTFNVNSQTWNTLYSDAGDPITGMATSTNNVLLYSTSQKLYKVSGVVVPAPQVTRDDITANFTSRTGVPLNQIVDMTGAFQYNILLNKNGAIYVTGDAGVNWQTYPAPAFIQNNAEAIGSDGASAHPVIYGGGSLAVNTGNANWTNYGRVNTPPGCGNATSVEFDSGFYIVGTDAGCLLYSNNGTNWSQYNYKAPGGYIVPDIYSAGGHIYFSGSLSTDRTLNGFFDLDWPGGFPGPARPGLWATIPGCKVGKSASYIVGGTLGYFATIQDGCNPNDTTPPPVVTPGGGETIVSSTTNTYTMETKGVSIHTRVAGPDGTATVKRGENATFTLTVNNPDATAKNVTVRFLVPQGFSFTGVVPPTPGVTRTEQVGGQTQLVWENYSASPGSNNFLTINTTAPTQ